MSIDEKIYLTLSAEKYIDFSLLCVEPYLLSQSCFGEMLAADMRFTFFLTFFENEADFKLLFLSIVQIEKVIKYSSV